MKEIKAMAESPSVEELPQFWLPEFQVVGGRKLQLYLKGQRKELREYCQQNNIFHQLVPSMILPLLKLLQPGMIEGTTVVSFPSDLPVRQVLLQAIDLGLELKVSPRVWKELMKDYPAWVIRVYFRPNHYIRGVVPFSSEDVSLENFLPLVSQPLVLANFVEAWPEVLEGLFETDLMLKAYGDGGLEKVKTLLPHLITLQRQGAFERHITHVIRPLLELSCLKSDEATLSYVRDSELIIPVGVWSELGDNYCSGAMRSKLGLNARWV
jgi:hypothetical protein